MAFLPVKVKVALTLAVQHLSKPLTMLLHIFPPHNKIIPYYLNTFNALKQMDHNILGPMLSRMANPCNYPTQMGY